MAILVLVTLLGLIPAAIARSKGHSFAGWWLYGALLFIVALPHSLLLRTDAEAIDKRKLEQGYRKCLECAELFRKEALRCPHCRALAVPSHSSSCPGPEPQDDFENADKLIARYRLKDATLQKLIAGQVADASQAPATFGKRRDR